MQSAIQLVQVISPDSAGVLVASVSAKFFLADSLSFLFSALMIYDAEGLGTILREAFESCDCDLRNERGNEFIFCQYALFVIISTVGMFAIRCFFALIAV